MAFMLLISLGCGRLARTLGQTQVIGGLFGRIFIGPSVFGRIAPKLFARRGLVELIVLNIAYYAHVFSPTVFTILVIMALVTTVITVPILKCLKISTRVAEDVLPKPPSESIPAK